MEPQPETASGKSDTGFIDMSILKNVGFWFICALVSTSTFNAHAATVSYTLENVFLERGAQMTGEFNWTYTAEDFEGGSGVFTALDLPFLPGGSTPPLDRDEIIINIENNQIEIGLDGNFHDYGLTVILKFLTPLSATQSSVIDLANSFYECCGNGFQDQPFASGSISPVPLPAAAWLFGSALLGMGMVRRRKQPEAGLRPLN